MPELDVNQAEIEVAVAEVAISVFERSVVQTENALRDPARPQPGTRRAGSALDQQTFPPEVPGGPALGTAASGAPMSPAPKRSSPHRPHASARPRHCGSRSLSLTGFAGVESTDLSDLNSSDAGTWSIDANIFAPIFNSGKLKANVEIERRAQSSCC